MKNLFYISLLLLPVLGFSQARLVFNDNSYINIENNACLVIDNGDANAITLLGSGGNILSENENDVVKWNIGANTGNYVIPWTNTNGVKVPLGINVTGAGDANGNLFLSTYRTANNNTPYPSGVNNMCSSVGSINASLHAIDRFWRIDPVAYASRPSVTLSFGYDYTSEGAPANTITESNLQAQRFNPGSGGGNYCEGIPSVGSWQDLLFGTVNTVTKRVNDVVVSPANFFKDWVLVDQITPLNITLLGFDVNCMDGRNVLNWSTASETDNAYFVIEKCVDAANFYEIATINGDSATNTASSYSYTDETANTVTVYYRIKQVNTDGGYQYFNTISSTNCTNENEFGANQFVFNDNALQFNVITSAKENIDISLYDYRGSLIANKKINAEKGINAVTLDNVYVSNGMYFLNITGTNKAFNTKVVK